MSKARDYGIDNLKAIAIFLVVLSHMIRRPFEFNEALYPLQAMIQAFTMPLFVFISGYLGKKTEKHLRSSITDLLIPYVAFNVFYRAIGNHALNSSII